MGSQSAPVEAKVKAATGGASASVVLAAFVVWALQQYVFAGSSVPVPVQNLVYVGLPLLITAVGTFVAGYLANHTERPDLRNTRQATPTTTFSR